MAVHTTAEPVAQTSSATGSAQAAPKLFDQAGLHLLQDYGLECWQRYLCAGERVERVASERYGPIFRLIRDAMKDQGARNDLKKKKSARDTGFRAWLAEHKIPHTRIYQWIKEDEIRTGDRNPPKPKTPALALTTSYGSVRSSAPAQPAPGPDVDDGQDTEAAGDKPVTKKLFYSQADAGELDRLEHELRLHLGTDNASDTVLAALKNLHNLFVTTASLRAALPNGPSSS
jgi:hypothetical protein